MRFALACRSMDAERNERALARIEAALARIEAAAKRPRETGGGEALTALQARHDRLKAVVADSLGEIDALIEAAGS